MKAKLLTALAVISLVAALALTSGCTRVRLQDRPETRTTTESRTVNLDGATELATDLRVGVGDLTISAAETSGTAMVADFVYAPISWKPEVDYSVEGTAGRLTVKQPDKVKAPAWGDVRYEWNVRLGTAVPTDLRLQLGVGRSRVDLRNVDVTAIDVLTGVGDTTIDLSGPRTHDITGSVQAGVGKLTLRVPSDIGVKINGREDGVGHFSADGFTARGDSWVNDAYGQAGPKIEIDLTRGVGDVTLVLVSQ